MRFLCLHGRGTNSRIFEVQTAPLRYCLGDDHSFEFVEGLIKWPQAAEIRNLFPATEEYYTYFIEEPSSFHAALLALDEYIKAEGPFDGILAFSQGALLAATYLARRYPGAEYTAHESIRFAVFICGMPPIQSMDGDTRTIQEDLDGEVIHIPTAHILGADDPGYKSSVELSRICGSRGRSLLDHGGGHEIPRGRKHTTNMSRAIKETIDQTMTGQ